MYLTSCPAGRKLIRLRLNAKIDDAKKSPKSPLRRFQGFVAGVLYLPPLSCLLLPELHLPDRARDFGKLLTNRDDAPIDFPPVRDHSTPLKAPVIFPRLLTSAILRRLNISTPRGLRFFKKNVS